MNRTKITLILTLTVVLILALALALGVSAQEPEEREEAYEMETNGAVGGMGLADPPTAGYSVLYMFTGAGNDNTGADVMATVVICTNFGASDVDVEVQLFGPTAGAMWSATATLPSNKTTTFASQLTSIYYNEIDLGALNSQQGSGRVLATSTEVICTAQLVDPDSDQPSFMSGLQIYDMR